MSFFNNLYMHLIQSFTKARIPLEELLVFKAAFALYIALAAR